MSTDTTPATSPAAVAQAATMKVTVEGHTHDIPAGTPIEAIRDMLVDLGFPHIRTAKVEQHTAINDGVAQEMVEFVKQAGTKGLSGATLATVLTHMPGLPLEDWQQRWQRRQRLPAAVRYALQTERLCIADVIDDPVLERIFAESLYWSPGIPRDPEVMRLWQRFAQLAPIAADQPPHGW